MTKTTSFAVVCYLFFTILSSNAALLSPDEQVLKVKPVKDSHSDEKEIIQGLRQEIKNKEEELDKRERVNKSFERLVQLVNIVGQIDSFLTVRAKNVIRKLAALAAEENDLYGFRNDV